MLYLIPGFFQLTYVRNYGAAFGILRNHTSIFIAISLLMGLIIIIYGPRYIPARYLMLRIAMAVLLGGTLGNLTDRVLRGYVIDFFDFRVWPVFNIADIAVVLGVALVIFSLLRSESLFQDHKR